MPQHFFEQFKMSSPIWVTRIAKRASVGDPQFLDFLSVDMSVKYVVCLLHTFHIWYGNSLFDIAEKYIVFAKYLIKYMIYVWRLH